MQNLSGMDAHTGAVLSGVGHLKQSIADILSTPVGSRLMNPEYGSHLRRMVDLPVTRGWASSVQAEVFRALGRWEPRIALTRVQVVSCLDGVVNFQMQGKYQGETTLLEITV